MMGKPTTAFEGYEGILLGYSTGYISDFIFVPEYVVITTGLSAYKGYEFIFADFGLVKTKLKGQYGSAIDVQTPYGFDYLEIDEKRYTWNSSEVRPL